MRLVKLAQGVLVFRCPGCGYGHTIYIGAGAPHTWNRSADRPTIRPALTVRTPGHVCDSLITDGCISFAANCTHALAGQTVDLPVWQP